MSESESEISTCRVTDNPKKRPKTFRASEVVKKLRLASYATQEDCRCNRLKCFQEVPESARRQIIKNFNSATSHNEQSLYLSGLVSVLPVKQRRSRKANPDNSHNHSYTYKVRFTIDSQTVEKQVCYKAFLSIFGITNKRMQNIKKSLSNNGTIKPDCRGKHDKHTHQLPEATKEAVIQHISSYKGRKSHYSIHDSDRTYLAEDLNVKKMYNLFVQAHPSMKLSYESYRIIFMTKFNISFGYPRTDTCSFCDEINVKIKSLELSNLDEQQEELLNLKTQLKLHLHKADKFYELKRKARLKAQHNPKFEAFAFDYQKNLPLPNVTTNDVYFKRQLSFYSFNVHQLSTRSSYFYVYDETKGKKGSDDVVSLLDNFITHFVSEEVDEIQFFCDSCSGQNKNYTVFRYMYYLVHVKKRFSKISIIFPVRGHSYMECDKNMGLINQKTPCELPYDWVKVFSEARSFPEPFKVIDCALFMFKNYSAVFKNYYVNKCPFASRPVRQLTVTKKAPNQILIKSDQYSGRYESYICVKRGNPPLPDMESIEQLYLSPIKISMEKYDDLQCLKKFCKSEAQQFYTNLQKK